MFATLVSRDLSGAKVKVFLAFDAADRAEAERLIRELELRGFEVVTDRDLPHGGNWKAEVERRVREADTVLVLVSARSVASSIAQITASIVSSESKSVQSIAIGNVDSGALPRELTKNPVIPFPEAARPGDSFERIATAIAEGDKQRPAEPHRPETAPLSEASAAPAIPSQQPLISVPVELALRVQRAKEIVNDAAVISSEIVREQEHLRRLREALLVQHAHRSDVERAARRTSDWSVSFGFLLAGVALATAYAVEHGLGQKLLKWLSGVLGLTQGTLPIMPSATHEGREGIETESIEADFVDFSVFAPREAPAGKAITVHLFLNNTGDFAEVQARMAARDPAAADQDSRTLLKSIPRGALLTVDIDCAGLMLEKPAPPVLWLGTMQSTKFKLRIPDNTPDGHIFSPEVVLKMEGLPIGILFFDVRCAAGEGDPSRGKGGFKWTYSFISYANEDIERVNERRWYWQAAGHDYFFDKEMVSGSEWPDEIPAAIDRCDCFVLCWSHHSRKSSFCRREFNHFNDRRNRGKATEPSGPRLPDFYPMELEVREPFPVLWPELKRFQFKFVRSKGDTGESWMASAPAAPPESQATGDAEEPPMAVSAAELSDYVARKPQDALVQDALPIIESQGWYLGTKPVEGLGSPLLRVGQEFRDGERNWSPLMVVVRPGSFDQGAPDGENLAGSDERPIRRVTFKRVFAVAKFPVTVDEWAAFVSERDGTDGSGRLSPEPVPVVEVTWNDAMAYVAWLSQKTGRNYRLLTEAEWEYACRAGTRTAFWTGSTIERHQANFDGTQTYGGSSVASRLGRAIHVGTFRANPFGLHDMHGNVWEWVEDDYHAGYAYGPSNGSAWTSGKDLAVARGGSFRDPPWRLRSAARLALRRDAAADNLGFRVARDL